MEEVGSLKNKTVCAYCGTIYDNKMDQCPLCGSAPEQGVKKTKKKQKDDPGNRVPKPLMTASVALLTLSLVILGWFILGQYFPKLDFIGRAKQGTSEAKPKQILCTDVTVAQNPLSFTQLGQTIALSPAKYPENSTDEIIVSSADNSIVRVDSEGNATAVAPGTTTITVACGNCRLDIPAEVKKSFSFEADQLTFDRLDETQTLVISGVTESDFIDWTTTDRTVASVNENGEVTSNGNGTCKILATIEDITLSANITVSTEPEPTEPEPEQTERIGTLNTDGVNVRSGPGKEYDPVSYCTLGETITVLETDGEWCKIETSAGVVGYIMDKFIHYED